MKSWRIDLVIPNVFVGLSFNFCDQEFGTKNNNTNGKLWSTYNLDNQSKVSSLQICIQFLYQQVSTIIHDNVIYRAVGVQLYTKKMWVVYISLFEPRNVSFNEGTQILESPLSSKVTMSW